MAASPPTLSPHHHHFEQAEECLWACLQGQREVVGEVRRYSLVKHTPSQHMLATHALVTSLNV